MGRGGGGRGRGGRGRGCGRGGRGELGGSGGRRRAWQRARLSGGPGRRGGRRRVGSRGGRARGRGGRGGAHAGLFERRKGGANGGRGPRAHRGRRARCPSPLCGAARAGRERRGQPASAAEGGGACRCRCAPHWRQPCGARRRGGAPAPAACDLRAGCGSDVCSEAADTAPLLRTRAARADSCRAAQRQAACPFPLQAVPEEAAVSLITLKACSLPTSLLPTPRPRGPAAKAMSPMRAKPARPLLRAAPKSRPQPRVGAGRYPAGVTQGRKWRCCSTGSRFAPSYPLFLQLLRWMQVPVVRGTRRVRLLREEGRGVSSQYGREGGGGERERGVQ